MISSIDNDEDMSALYRALLHECLENIDFLLSIEASIPNPDELGIDSLEKYIQDYFEGDIKAQGLKILEKHDLVS